MKLNKKLIERAAELISLGNYQRHVAKALGISEDTWYRWLREGKMEKKNSLKRKFYEAIQKAEAEAIIRNLLIIQKEAKNGNWQAAAWFLERKAPEEWGRKDKATISTEGNGLVIKIEKVDGVKND